MDFMAPCAASAKSGRYHLPLECHSADSLGRTFNRCDACFRVMSGNEMKNIDRPVPIGGQIGVGVCKETRRETQDCIHVQVGTFARHHCRSQLPSQA